MKVFVCHSYFVVTAIMACWTVEALTPLTEIKPDVEELSAFAATLRAAVTKVSSNLEKPVIHVIGATSVEDAVDWSAFCKDGVSLVLAGPQVEPLAKMVKGEEVVPRQKAGQECVTVVRGLYSRGFLRLALGEEHPSVEPDMVIAYNADVYMDYWRRSLAELLQIRKPVIVTMYCEYEGGEILKLLQNPQEAFSTVELEKGNAYIRKRYRGDADDFLDATPVESHLPSARLLWAFEENPNAHLPPRDCLAKPYRHGVRNSYWIAFSGSSPKTTEL